MPITLPPLSRRSFLRHSALAVGAAALGHRRVAAAAATPADPHSWALLSDPHLAADRTKVARGAAIAPQFTRVADDVLALPRRPAGLIVNGDLAFNTGETADYAVLADLVAPLRAAAIPLHLALGNHDHRERFRAALRAAAFPAVPVADREAARVPAVRANWFILDSLDQTNRTPGLLGSAQLDWLARELDAHRDKPAIVLTHHNPTPDPAKVTLIDEAALDAVLQPRRHVKAHVFGHSHRWSVTQDASGLHRINLPTTAYVFDAQQPAGWVHARLEPQGMTLRLHALDPRHPAHLETKTLAWRT